MTRRSRDPVLEMRAEELATNLGGLDWELLDEDERDEYRTLAMQMYQRKKEARRCG